MGPGATAGVAAARVSSRLALLRRLGRDPGAVACRVVGAVDGMPFRLGEGPRDFCLPFAWDDRIDGLATSAVEGLCELLSARRLPGQGSAPPARFGVRHGLPRGAAAVAEAAALDPHLDPALALAWWDRVAAELSAALEAAFRRAFDAELAAPERPPFAYLVALACTGLPARVKSQSLRGFTYERLEKAVGFAFFALVEAAAGAAMDELSGRPGPIDPGPSFDRVRLVLDPLAFCSIRTRALQNDVNPWDLPEEAWEAWEGRTGKALEASGNWSQVEREAMDRVVAEPRLRETLERVGRRARLRERLLALLQDFDRGDDASFAEARAALASNEALDAFRADGRAALAALRPAAAQARTLLSPLLGPGATSEDLQRGVDSLIAYRADRLIADAIDLALRGLRDERSRAGSHELAELYRRGRLYRLSGDGMPLIQTAETRSAGFLFVDLKGFTQRTVRSKEIAVADFLRTEFYEPILAAARAQIETQADELRLLNLVGDAAAFAGDIPRLVSLAVQIRKICADYERKLEALAPGAPRRAVDPAIERQAIESRQTVEEEPLLLEKTLLEGELARKAALSAQQLWAELERQLAARNAQLAAAFEAASARLAAALEVERPALEAELARIGSAQEALVSGAHKALERLEGKPDAARAAAVLELLTGRERSRLQELDRALAAVRERAARELADAARAAREAGSGLVAGVFISFGTAPEDIRIPDPVFGEVRVSVAERLNEAARGTGRSGRVKAEADDEARRSAIARGNAALRDPFLVHLDAPDAGQPSSEIYNGGQALSAEALDTFLRATAGPRFHFERTVVRAELAEEIVARLLLPERWKLVVSVPALGKIADALAFRRVGPIVFRGFEEAGACTVYEMLPADGPLMRLLLRNHLAHWAQEARASPAGLLTCLPREAG